MSLEQDCHNASEYLRELMLSTIHYTEAMKLLAAIAQELEYGQVHCYECAKTRVIASLETFFHYSGLSATKAIEVLTDYTVGCKQHM